MGNSAWFGRAVYVCVKRLRIQEALCIKRLKMGMQVRRMPKGLR